MPVGNAAAGQYREVPQDDRDWLKGHLDALRAQGMPIVAIDYLPPERRDEARALAARLRSEGYVPFVSTPALDYLGVSDVEVQPRRIALLYDPREGDLTLSPGHVYLGGLLEYLGYRVDYLPTDQPLPERPLSGIYAGVVTWMTSGPPLASDAFDNWIAARLDEKVPVAFLAGLPTENDGLLQRLGIRRLSQKLKVKPSTETHDQALLGAFEAPLVIRVRDLPALTVLDPARVAPALKLKGDGKEYVPVATADWGGFALAPMCWRRVASTGAGSSIRSPSCARPCALRRCRVPTRPPRMAGASPPCTSMATASSPVPRCPAVPMPASRCWRTSSSPIRSSPRSR